MLAFHDKFTKCVGAGVPVPVSVSMMVEGWALLVKVSEALAAPFTCGLKVTVKDALCPAGIVSGSAKPPTLKAELFVVALLTVTLAPLAVRLPDALPLVPTTTLPRPRVPGETANCPTVEVPVPDSAIVRVELDASEVMVTVPLALPADCGENATVNVVL